MIKETFIKFLKQKHALKEWIQEVEHGHNIPTSSDDLLSTLKTPKNSEYM